jgi:hypothetical protein
MSKKDECKKELKDIDKRNDAQKSENWEPRQLCSKCLLHRWIHRDWVNEWNEIFQTDALIDHRMSVIVECFSCSFGPVDLRRAANLAINVHGFPLAGSIILPASFFIDAAKWHLKDDPFDFEYRGIRTEQHPNHFQIICQKDQDVWDELKGRGCLKWHVPPGQQFPSLE